MDRFARLHTSYLAAPEHPSCRGEGCRNDHLDADGQCADCAHAEAAEALDCDALFIGAATEAPPALVRALIAATSRTQLAAVRASTTMLRALRTPGAESVRIHVEAGDAIRALSPASRRAVTALVRAAQHGARS